MSLDKRDIIHQLGSWTRNHKLPFVAFRKPGGETKLISSFSGLADFDGELESLPYGFVLSSFDNKKYFISADIEVNLDSKELNISPLARIPSDITLPFEESSGTWAPYTGSEIPMEECKEEFEKKVQYCVDQIDSSRLTKVVPSRVRHIKKSGAFDVAEAFLTLCKKYDNSFVSLISASQLGTWVGATPETLISQDNDGIFKTMSLAGTQEYTGDKPLHEVAWTQKEIEEQAMVSRYIINRFKEIRLREFEEVGPRTVQAGNLAHLCSTYTVDTKATEFPDLGSIMLKLLHPTSAVCGMPKNDALKTIKEVENHNRKLYAGYLGPINDDEGTNIYVNLRCMEVFQELVVLHAGVGVTAWSNPEHEWIETELKCNTLMSAINF